MIHFTFESVKSVTALPLLSMPGVIFLEHFNCNNLFLSAGCLLMNCVRDNNQGVFKNVNGACARQPVEFEIIS